jgi:plasmid stabilization system protein ParE
MKKITFLPLAEQEMNEAAIFYEIHSRGLGRAFLSAIKRETDDITHNPRAYPVQRNGIRRKLTRRFPYAILYSEEEEQVVVIAVMHLHRAPDYWRHRISEPLGN